MLSWSLNFLKLAERNSSEIILQNKSPALFMWVGYKRQSSNMFRQSWLSALTFMWDVCASWPCSVSGGELQGIYFSTGSKCTCEGRLMTERRNRTYPDFKDAKWGCVLVISLLLCMMHCALFQLLRTLYYLRMVTETLCPGFSQLTDVWCWAIWGIFNLLQDAWRAFSRPSLRV